uniref:NAD(P)/FAD-dependent oxidoreductase n=1 Tax=candidate division WOR-3 bacterium TaxID=2052148 RepID=A0A7C4UBW1_UNCW3
MKKDKKIVIIGAGPSGCAVALQLKRYNISPLIFEKEGICELLKSAYKIENYPGFPEGISGEGLARNIERQIRKEKIKVIYEEVIKIYYKDGIFSIETKKRRVKSDILVIATGTEPKKIPLLRDKNVFYEIKPIFKKDLKKILIIGAGDIAFDYALNLSSKGKFVTILNRGENAKCNMYLYKKVMNDERINYRKNIQVIDVKKENKMLKIICKTEKGNIVEYADAILVSIGRLPSLNFIDKNFKGRMKGLIKEKKLFLAGDVKNGMKRQIGIAVGDGIKTGMEIYENHFKIWEG